MFRIVRYTSVNEIPVSDWNRLASRQTVGLEMAHLQAVEVSGINDIHPYYLIGYSDEEPVGIAYCFAIDINLAKLANSYSPEVINTVRTWKPGFMDMRIVEVGHIASLGSAIEVLQPCFKDFLQTFSDEIDKIARDENADLCIIRDITSSDYAEYRELNEYGYKAAMGFPTARLQLKWSSFEEYLDSLKAKKRNYIRHRREKLLAPGITVEIIEDYASYANRLAELWTNVAKRQNGYEHEHLTPDYFEAMSYYLKGRSHVVAIKKDSEIVAFGLYLIGDEEYFGVAEGLDYDVRDDYDLYANNLLEGIRVGCELGKKTYNIGITSYDFKTLIGAELEPNIYFVKAFKDAGYSAVYADMIQKSIKQPENHHRVFRNSNILNRSQIKDTAALIKSSKNNKDPFAKHLNYIRADALRSAGIYAFSPAFESAQEPVILYHGREVIMLGTNSYLGLATHPKIKEAAWNAIDKYGSGCSGSPMLNGTLDLHVKLSDELSRFMHKDSALIFSTGYQTNVGAISALVSRNDVLVMDERCHASLIDGARLARAAIARYRHNDPESLEKVLEKYADRPKLVVTDSLFSMEGTVINLPEIIQLVKRYDARLMLDESHAIGVIGPTGRGVAEYYGLLDEADIVMGTFSKSFASVGGFVAGDRKIIDTLKHTARSHIFSASLPPASVAVVLAAIKIIDEEPELRKRLLDSAEFLADGLRDSGYEICHEGSAIISLCCGNELLTISAFHKLLDEGVFVNPVTHPAVPKNREMLRISLMATHDETMLRHALDIFKKIRTPYWP